MSEARDRGPWQIRRLDPALTALLLTLGLVRTLQMLLVVPDRGGDFESFYRSALAWWAGGNPYQSGLQEVPNLTPPFMLPFYLPFTLLHLDSARTAWAIVSVSCLVACIDRVRVPAGLGRIETLALLTAIAPTTISLGLGQVGPLLMLVMTFAWSAAQERRQGAEGVLLGVLCSIKPFFGLFALWSLYRRQWTTLSWLAFTVVGAAGLSLVVAGSDACLAWLKEVSSANWLAHLYNASVFGVASRLFGPTLDMRAATWSPLIVSRSLRLLCSFSLGLAVAFPVAAALKRDGRDEGYAYALLSVTSLLLAPLAWVHYLTIGFGPIIAVLMRRPGLGVFGLLAWAIFPFEMLATGPHDVLMTVLAGQWAFGLASLTLLLLLRTVRPV